MTGAVAANVTILVLISMTTLVLAYIWFTR
jgi:hypothetical protein